MEKRSFAEEMEGPLSKDPRWELIQRIVSSQHFKTSARLREFLLYAGECALHDSPQDLTEQQIGIHVFHRAPGYNSSQDSIVRSHARLLRKKLSEYFSGEGASEALILEIPKGHYLPIFRAAGLPSVPEAKEDGHRPPEAPEKTSASTESNGSAARFPRFWLAVAACILILVSAIAIPWFRSKPPVGSMETFWSPFLSGGPPLVIYSNALFVTDSDHGVKVASVDATDFPHQAIRENYGALLTGTGAVIAVRQLTQLFDAHNANFTLKRSLLVTWDEARSTNLIFLGSRAQNPALTMLDSMKDFALLADSGIPTGFVNLHPKAGELAVYSRPADFFTKDYAVIALSPGLQPSKWILSFSGLSTLGTEAAVEYACRPEDVASLLRAASLKPGELRPFEALLETKIVGGVPMPAKLVTIRTH